MSGSQEKKRRQSQRLEGTEKRQIASEKERERKKRSRIITSIVGTLVGIFLIFVVVVNSNLFYTVLPAVTVGGRGYSAAEFNYYYYNSYYNLVSQLGGAEAAGSLIDPSIPFSEQMVSDTQSWDDYFKEAALDSMLKVKSACFAAEEAGFTLSAESEEAIAQELAGFESAYQANGYQTLKQYLVASFGRGASMEIIEKVLRDSYTAGDYSQQLYDSYEYTDEEIELYYTEHQNEYDYFTFRSAFISGAEDEDAGVDSEAAMASAKAAAEKIAEQADSEESFAQLALASAPVGSQSAYEDPDYTKTTSVGSSLDSAYSEWMTDPARREGDTAALEGTDGYYALYFIGRDDNGYNVRQVRHILVMGVEEESDADTGGMTDEELSALDEQRREDAKAAALTRAEEIYEEWKAGDATEDSFAELADLYSEDGGSNTVGGLYDEVPKGQMVAEFDAFIYDPDRQPGDTGIVYGESSSYFGYHVMYYVGEGDLYRSLIAKYAKKNEDLTAWQTAETEKNEIEQKFAFRFTGR